MSNNVNITPGSGNAIAADEVTDGVLGTVKVQYVKLIDGTLGGTTKATVTSNGLKVDGSAVTQPVSGPLTDTQLRAAAVPVSGAFWQTTQPISGAVSVNNLPSTQPVSAVALPLPSGASTETTLALIKAKTDNIDVALSTRTKPSDTQPVSVASLPLPTGAATSALQTQPGIDIGDVTINNASGASSVNIQDGGNSLTVDGSVSVSNFPSSQPVTGTFWQSTQPVSGTFFQATQPVSGTVAVTESGTWTVQPGNTANTTPWLTGTIPASLIISSTAATGVGVTATLPAVASQFHYIALIEITKIFTAANAASATPLVVTTTNLPGSYAFSFGQPLGTIGTSDERIYQFENPVKSSTVNTNTTIVCPATTGIIWRVNVHYYAAV